MNAVATSGRPRTSARVDEVSTRHTGSFAGTGTAVRLALRRDRILLPVWILVFVVVAYSSAAAALGLYPDAASRTAAAEAANATPAIVALYGPVHDPSSLGGVAMIKLTVLGAVFVVVLMAMTLVRHTRAEEESGRLELMRAGVLGRRAPLAAALIVTVGASLVLGVLTALGLVASGLEPAGSVAFGLSWACAGTAFAGVAALAAQATEGARAATGLVMSALGVSYLLRALGDTAHGGSWLAALSWLSPLGWAEQIRPFGGNRWWVALLLIAFTAATAYGAFVLSGRRDLGAGLVPPRPGPARAASRLSSPLALAWRLQRGALVAWLTAFVLLGLVLGGMASAVTGMADSPAVRDMITKMGGVSGLTDAFLSAELGVAAFMAAAYGVSATLRMRSEETALRAEPLLATSVTRTGWVASHVAVAFVGCTVLMVGIGLGAGLTHGASTGDVGGAIAGLLGAALVRLPAAWLLIGVAVALFGLLPRWVLAAWVALVASVVLGEFGAVLGLPESARQLSPFGHVPSLPGGEMAWLPLGALTVIAAALVAVGVAGFRRRDVG